ncbi:MAG: hypothetical protein AAGF02_04610 [Actinomycetota bacterium]
MTTRQIHAIDPDVAAELRASHTGPVVEVAEVTVVHVHNAGPGCWNCSVVPGTTTRAGATSPLRSPAWPSR